MAKHADQLENCIKSWHLKSYRHSKGVISLWCIGKEKPVRNTTKGVITFDQEHQRHRGRSCAELSGDNQLKSGPAAIFHNQQHQQPVLNTATSWPVTHTHLHCALSAVHSSSRDRADHFAGMGPVSVSLTAFQLQLISQLLYNLPKTTNICYTRLDQ
jgi:hypothetical protein